jgi:hypothetical protein
VIFAKPVAVDVTPMNAKSFVVLRSISMCCFAYFVRLFPVQFFVFVVLVVIFVDLKNLNQIQIIFFIQ